MATDKLDIILENQRLLMEKVDSMGDKINKIAITQERQASDIEHHIKRTDLLQDMIEPIHTKYQQLIGVAKFLGASSLIAGVVMGVKKLLRSLGIL